MSEHERLWSIVRQLPEDYLPYGTDDRSTHWFPDCSVGCQFFKPLAGELSTDWGVCANPLSHRCGLLTFEHQGCRSFEQECPTSSQ